MSWGSCIAGAPGRFYSNYSNCLCFFETEASYFARFHPLPDIGNVAVRRGSGGFHLHIFIEVVGVNRLLVIPPGVVVACVLTTKERTDTMPKKHLSERRHPQAQRRPLGGSLRPGHVNTKNKGRGVDNTIRLSPVLSAFGSAFGSRKKSKCNTQLYNPISKKSSRFPAKPRTFWWSDLS